MKKKAPEVDVASLESCDPYPVQFEEVIPKWSTEYLSMLIGLAYACCHLLELASNLYFLIIDTSGKTFEAIIVFDFIFIFFNLMMIYGIWSRRYRLLFTYQLFAFIITFSVALQTGLQFWYNSNSICSFNNLINACIVVGYMVSGCMSWRCSRNMKRKKMMRLISTLSSAPPEYAPPPAYTANSPLKY